MKSKRQIIYERAEKYAKSKLRKIDVDMGEYRGNKMCQHNARQCLEEGTATHIVATLAFVPNSGVNVHIMPVINGKVVDNTLGYLSKYNIYYLIKEYYPDELVDVHMTKLLNDLKDKYLHIFFSPKELDKYEISPELI